MTDRIRTAEGTYVPRRRLEVETFPAVTDFPLGKVENTKLYRLVQHDPDSPHPISWRSMPLSTMEGIRKVSQLIRLDEEGDPEVPRGLSNLTSLAFDRHRNANHLGALIDCSDCYTTTSDIVRAAAEELAVWDEWRLSSLSPPAVEATT